MKPIHIVLDTNVYIAAALNPQSILYQVVQDSAAQNLATYFASPAILQELQYKLEDKFNFPRFKVVNWISHIERTVSVVHPTIKLAVVERDPADNKILECAVHANAELIISADKDLLALKIYNGIKIIHPSSVKYLFPQLKALS